VLDEVHREGLSAVEVESAVGVHGGHHRGEHPSEDRHYVVLSAFWRLPVTGI
jgi:hypothetical protein